MGNRDIERLKFATITLFIREPTMKSQKRQEKREIIERKNKCKISKQVDVNHMRSLNLGINSDWINDSKVQVDSSLDWIMGNRDIERRADGRRRLFDS